MAIKPVYGVPETVYSNPHQKVYRVLVEAADRARELYVTDYGSRAGVIVHGPEGILLTRQYRYLIGRLSWEIPGGRADPDEEPDAAGRRECLEETGVRCGALQPLLTFQPGLDTLHNPTHLFHTSDFVREDQPPHSDEVTERVWIKLERCLEMIFSGAIVDSISIIALLSYARRIESADV